MPLCAFGSNGSGQLGIGHDDDICVPQLVKLPGSSIPIQIAAGGNHTLIVLANGEVHTAGEDRNGRRVDDKAQFDFANIDLVAATWEASTFVSSDAVWTCGLGLRGELGLGTQLTEWLTPRVVQYDLHQFPPVGTTIVDISACMTHTVCVLDNGDVYGWGQGRKGQLGEPENIAWTPRKIAVQFPAKRVACGKEFTYVVGEPGEGRHQVLGSDKWSVRSDSPVFVPKWADIGAAWGSIYVLLDDGKLLSWGRNDHGQLPPKNLPTLEMIAVGSEHVIAKTKSGKVITWGWGEHGNCGTPTDAKGNVAGRWNEIYVKGKVKLLAAGCATSFIYSE